MSVPTRVRCGTRLEGRSVSPQAPASPRYPRVSVGWDVESRVSKRTTPKAQPFDPLFGLVRTKEPWGKLTPHGTLTAAPPPPLGRGGTAPLRAASRRPCPPVQRIKGFLSGTGGHGLRDISRSPAPSISLSSPATSERKKAQRSAPPPREAAVLQQAPAYISPPGDFSVNDSGGQSVSL